MFGRRREVLSVEVVWANVWKTQGGAVRSLTNIYSLAPSPTIWFERAELSFEVSGIMTERERFAHAVNALSQDAMHLVTDLITAPPADRPYTALKERLLISHQLSPVQKAAKVLNNAALGYRQPSNFLVDLLEYCPTGEENSAFFRAIYVQRLPSDMLAGISYIFHTVTFYTVNFYTKQNLF